MKFEEVMKEAEARRVSLPSDMLQAAKSIGLREVVLVRYLDLQGSIWPVGFAMRSCSWLRNRMPADPSFLFKVGTEVAIDSCCAHERKSLEDQWQSCNFRQMETMEKLKFQQLVYAPEENRCQNTDLI
ncbi:protein RETICULATA-RELATED 1, chloroplastic-like [Macadamia integrifolia]|uniref:protein RETICULATA-RELATED 1, chloroplastic-like n=1 Tax=Macadamia integrifolia TaxID=60698 RepID=UPI001C501A62|nr:protein RETICULATA-RELATED 1, chloroplastic-like [Macadamia integrifolia]